jgi:hypothetical protein
MEQVGGAVGGEGFLCGLGGRGEVWGERLRGAAWSWGGKVQWIT